MKKLIPLLIVPLILPLFIPLIVPFAHAEEMLDGDLIKTSDSPDVYIVKLVGVKKFKRLILNPEIFNQYGHLKWENIKEVSQATVDEYTASDLVRAKGDEKVYKLYPNNDTGEKKWVKTADDFLGLGYDADSIYTINNFERDFYISGDDLTYQAPVTPPISPTPPTSRTIPTTINVPSDYATIQSAINAAINGDKIVVATGTYKENLIINKSIELVGNYLVSAVIDGQGTGPAIKIEGAVDFLIQGFTIQSKDEKAVYCTGETASKGTIKIAIIKNSGWGIFAEGNCNLTILNNLIYNQKDTAKTAGIGILIKNNNSYGFTSEIRNNTIDDNYQGVWVEDASVKTMNNIITNNLGLGNSTGIYHTGSGTINNTYNDVWQNGFDYQGNAKPGNGSISSDPNFVLPSQRDYRLKTGTTYSFCLDAGNPEYIYNDKTYDSNTERNDMGVYGGPDNIGWE